MGKALRVGLAAVLAGASIATLTWVAGRTQEPVRAARPESRDLVAAYDRAATQAHRQRVLVIHAPAGAEATGEIFESARSPEGWRLHPATPPGVEDLLPALASLAAGAAADWHPDERLEKQTTRALGYFGVGIVLIHDGKMPVWPEVDEMDAALSLRNAVPALGIRKAAPVHHLLAEPEMADPAGDVLEYARRLRAGDAHFTELEDAGWGGSMRVQAHLDSDFLLAWPATGARVTVDGRPVDPTPAALPLLRLHLPQGLHAVRVEYGSGGTGGWIAIVAAVVLMSSLVLLLRAIRPQMEHEPDSDDGFEAEPGA
jgi:hypothetical protein